MSEYTQKEIDNFIKTFEVVHTKNMQEDSRSRFSCYGSKSLAIIEQLQAKLQALEAENKELKDKNVSLKAEKGIADMGFVSEGASKEIARLQAELDKAKTVLEWITVEADAKDKISKITRLHRIKTVAEQALEVAVLRNVVVRGQALPESEVKE